MWRLLPVQSFLALVVVDGALLAAMLSLNVFGARRLRLCPRGRDAICLLRHAEEA
jgi:hypothetical protein